MLKNCDHKRYTQYIFCYVLNCDDDDGSDGFGSGGGGGDGGVDNANVTLCT